MEESLQPRDWNSHSVGARSSVIECFSEWLRYIRSEEAAAAREKGDLPPVWIGQFSPAEKLELDAQIANLTEQRSVFESRGRLLWQTGEPLVEAVRDTFSDLGFEAKQTARGHTFDLEVIVTPARRLLVEVTGADGPLAKSSGKIGQVLATRQLESFREGADRIVIAANMFRRIAPQSRVEPPITANALPLLAEMGCNIVLTSVLHEWWLLSRRGKLEEARGHVMELLDQNGGLYPRRAANREGV
jgi:hypothetical protein